MKLLLTSDGITTPAIAEAALALLPQGSPAMSALMVSQDALPRMRNISRPQSLK